MDFKTCEQKVLADLEQAEHDMDLLEQENKRLREEVETLEKRVIDLGEQANRLLVERDHHADCVKDMLATAKWYGFDQPQDVPAPPGLPGSDASEKIAELQAEIEKRDKGIERLKRQRDEARAR